MFEVLISARRTESQDAGDISKLVSGTTKELFGRKNIAHVIEKANFTLTIVDQKNFIVGFAAFYDYPCNSVDTPNWSQWLNQNYEDAKECTPVNTLFLHYIVSVESLSKKVEKEIARTVFRVIPLLHFLILTIPINVELGDSLNQLFSPINSNVGYVSSLKVTMCWRHNHFPVLHIRPARIEDHDDLKLILDQYNSDLVKTYGHFFLSELIEAQDEDNICLVADVNGIAVGLLSASTQIDTSVLKENFDLEVYENFSKKIQKRKELIKKTELQPSDSCDETSCTSVCDSSGNTREKHFLNSNGGHLVSPINANKNQSKLFTEHLQKQKPDVQSQVEYIIEDVFMESVFFIQIFFIDNNYEMRAIDFLPAAFEIFKQKDYLVITVPHTVPEFPLLQCFQRIPPKSNSIFSQELYVFNRNGLIRSFDVRPFKKTDLEDVTDLVTFIQGSKYILEDVNRYTEYRRDEDGTRLFAYVAEVFGQIVGLCIFKQEREIEYIRTHYNIEDFIYFSYYEAEEHARFCHFVLNPIFKHYSTYFLKEAFTLSKKSSLYYTLYQKREMKKGCSLPTCIDKFVPIRARRQVIYPVKELEENAPMPEILEEKEPFALYHFNRKMTFEHKAVVNIRVVVVGSSDVGLSFLQSLVYRPHLLFNNLTLVSDDDIFNTNDIDETILENFLLQSQDFNNKKLALLSLRTWVNFVHGKLTKIDREKKQVYVNKELVPYDQLILCTGESFHCTVPKGLHTNEPVALNCNKYAIQSSQLQSHDGQIPNGVYSLNSCKDVRRIFKWLEEIPKNETIVVYGSSLEAYVCIHGLISYGWSGTNIKHVTPFIETYPLNALCDIHVAQVIVKAIEKHGVQTYHGYTLSNWFSCGHSADIESALFSSESSQVKLSCKMLLILDKKTVDYDIFKAINDSYLVFDGKLVIDLKFKTNDLSIHAAGPLTKYGRRFYSESLAHQNFNSKEVGKKLSQYFVETLYPINNSIEAHNGGLATKFKKPKSVFCKLPGGFSYFRVWKQCDVSFDPNTSSRDITTGRNLTDDKQSYFRLHINQYNTVDEIVCLSSQRIDTSNLKCLFGIHTSYLGSLTDRFEKGLITDLYCYFRQPWCLAIYHDRFKDFRCEVRDQFKMSESTMNLSLEERIKLLIQDNSKLTEEARKRLLDSFVGSGCKKAIEEKMLLFLNYNKYHLPMFAKPSML